MTNNRSPYAPSLLLQACSSLLFACAWISVCAQNIHFERVPNELGLSQNFISALCIDHDGFLWVGTKEGLNRFDGYRFKVFLHDPFDTTSISGNYIKAILEDRHGRLWIGTTNGLNLFDRERETFQRLKVPDAPFRPARPVTENHPGLSHRDINCMLEDRWGNLWVGTHFGGVTKLEIPPGSRDLTQVKCTVFTKTEDENSLWDYPVTSMAVDEKGAVWVSGFGKTSIISGGEAGQPYHIRRMHWEDFAPQWKNYSQADFWYNENGVDQIDRRIHKVMQEGAGAVWVKSAGGFGKWKTDESRFELYELDIGLNDPGVLPLAGANGPSLFDRNGHLWVTGGWSVALYDTMSRKILLRYHHQDDAGIGLPKDAGCRSLLEDPNGNIWLGTNGAGLFKFTPTIKKFDGQYETLLWKGGSVRSICETSDGAIWLGLTNLRLLRLDRKTGQAKPVILERSRWSRTFEDELDYVHDMLEDRAGNLWVGSERGLFRFRLSNGELNKWDFFEIPKLRAQHKRSTILAIHEDEAGRLWLLTPFEFGRFFPETGRFEGYDYLNVVKGERLPDHYPCIYQQKNGTFWLGTHWGLLRFDPKLATYTFLTSNPLNPEGLSHPTVKCIYPDPDEPERVLWIGTGGGGLNRFDLETGVFSHFNTKNGLPDNVIYGILGDEAGNLWLSTNQGLSRFHPPSGVFKNYTVKNGLQDNEFNSAAYFKSGGGELFFGGINGFNAFRPEAIKDHYVLPGVVITGFKLANKTVDFKAPDSPLRKPISETDELVLTWKDKIFSFEFAALDLTAPERNQYAYRLEGFHDDWQYTGTERTATFTNLNPGKYTFRVKATNHDGMWNEEGAGLKITILPPWWRTRWAYLFYFLVTGSLLLGVRRFEMRRQAMKAEAMRLQELDSLKTRLYTNITHEFRTPLTVIMGMTEQLAAGSWQSAISDSDRGKLKGVFSLILRNSENLLRLINQMLDLSKLDSGALKMELVRGDIINYLQYLTESFHSMAQEKKIRLTFYSEIPDLAMDFDEGKVQHIVYNLLSNAIKFTGEGGKVVLHANQAERQGQVFLQLKVQDTGIGIPEGQLTRIFDRFFQADNSSTRKGEGTGIGLALTKELVELMGGSISVESTAGKGTTFTLLLPVKLEAGAPMASGAFQTTRSLASELVPGLPPANFPGVKAEGLTGEKPLLLLIEDNADVVTYIVGLLEKDYEIHTAPNGHAGIEKALELVPDIIISDVMMPEKDGYEVCEMLKNDERTSHIPIILLTAKAEVADRITGLRKGADAYLMKPFNKEELFVRLEKLLELRRALQLRYAGESFLKSSRFRKTEMEPAEPTLDDVFMQKIRQAIVEKMDDTELGIQDLCQAAHLGHTQVFRKLKALTGLNPTLFIRKMRLQKAALLLKTTERNISEIAYDVGFSDPNYFSRVFHEEFGVPPSAIRK